MAADISSSLHYYVWLGEKTCLCFLSVALQKPLRRIEIEEVSGKATVPEVESSGSKTLIQEVVREPEEDSSPLSTSPSAKIIKIEEMADAPSHVSEKLVTVFNYWLKPFDTFQSLCRLLYLFVFCLLSPDSLPADRLNNQCRLTSVTRLKQPPTPPH